jgi:hypothetical protein
VQDVAETTPFMLPPALRNVQGQVRRVGFELEYNGVEIACSARLVREVFGGTHIARSAFVHVVQSPHGQFTIEIDARVLKEKAYEKPLRAVGINPDRLETAWVEQALVNALSAIVPIEIATPPLPMDQLAPLEDLRRRLFEHGAKGTRAALLHAFGLHINAETPNLEAHVTRDYLRAFLLLYPWIRRRHEVDLARAVSPYISPFPHAYARLILRDEYTPSHEQLIDDYLTHNPTRNRPLDMLPLMAVIDEPRVLAKMVTAKLLKPRASFHYRLPNSMVDEADWTIAQEWNLWVAVERLAWDAKKLARMSHDYLEADEQSLLPFMSRWPEMVEEHLLSAGPHPTPSTSRCTGSLGAGEEGSGVEGRE